MTEDCNQPEKPKRGGRNARGHFLPGNAFGKGNPRLKQISKLRRAIEEVATEAELKKVVRSLISKAKGGSVIAAMELFDRALGKAHKEPRAISGFEIGAEPKSTAELVAAYGRLIGATTRGEVSTDDAKVIGDLLGGALKVAELAELEQRIAQLERQSQRPAEDEA